MMVWLVITLFVVLVLIAFYRYVSSKMYYYRKKKTMKKNRDAASSTTVYVLFHGAGRRTADSIFSCIDKAFSCHRIRILVSSKHNIKMLLRNRIENTPYAFVYDRIQIYDAQTSLSNMVMSIDSEDAYVAAVHPHTVFVKDWEQKAMQDLKFDNGVLSYFSGYSHAAFPCLTNRYRLKTVPIPQATHRRVQILFPSLDFCMGQLRDMSKVLQHNKYRGIYSLGFNCFQHKIKVYMVQMYTVRGGNPSKGKIDREYVKKNTPYNAHIGIRDGVVCGRAMMGLVSKFTNQEAVHKYGSMQRFQAAKNKYQ